MNPVFGVLPPERSSAQEEDDRLQDDDVAQRLRELAEPALELHRRTGDAVSDDGVHLVLLHRCRVDLAAVLRKAFVGHGFLPPPPQKSSGGIHLYDAGTPHVISRIQYTPLLNICQELKNVVKLSLFESIFRNLKNKSYPLACSYKWNRIKNGAGGVVPPTIASSNFEGRRE